MKVEIEESELKLLQEKAGKWEKLQKDLLDDIKFQLFPGLRQQQLQEMFFPPNYKHV